MTLTATTSTTLDRWFFYDLEPEQITIREARIGADGRYAFLSVSPRLHSTSRSARAVVLDLRDGGLADFGGRRQSALFYSLQGSEIGRWPITGKPALLTHVAIGGIFPSLYGNRSASRLVIDTSTLAVRSEVPLSIMSEERYGTVERACHDQLRETSGWRLPDGRRVWSFKNAIMCDDGDGVRTLLESERGKDYIALRWQVGFGLLKYGGSKFVKAFDLIREREYDVAEANWSALLILEDGWLVAKRRRIKRRTTVWSRNLVDWQLHDPDSGALRPAPGMLDDDVVATVLNDGRVIVVHDVLGVEAKRKHRPADPTMFVVDTASGERSPLSINGLSNGSIFTNKLWPAAVGGTDGDRLLARCGSTLVCLDPDSTVFRILADEFRGLAAIESEHSIIVILGENRLERINLDTGKHERLFPRGATGGKR